MPRFSVAFFAVGVVLVLAGMVWGMQMGASNDFALAPAHAHLNLIGWVTMGLYGTFYALARENVSPRLAWINFALSTLGVAVLIPSLTLFLSSGQDPKFLPGLISGEVLTVLGMAVFAVSVGRELLRARA